MMHRELPITVILTVLGAGAFVWLLALNPSFVPLAILVATGAAAIGWGVMKRDDPLNPLYGVTLYFLFGIAVRGLCVQLGLVPNPYLAPLYRQDLIVFAYLLALGALLMLFLGHASGTARALGRRIGGAGVFSVARDSLTLRAFVGACALVGIFQIIYFKQKYGLSLDIAEYRPQQVQKMTHGGGMAYITLLVNFPLTAFFLSLALLRESRWRVVFAGANLACVLAWALLVGSKTLVAQVMIGVFIVRFVGRRKIGALRIAFFSGALLVLISIGFFYRVHGVAGLGQWASEKSFWTMLLEPLLGRTAHFDMYLISLEKIGYGIDNLRLGENWLQLLYWFVPRAWWADKPVMFGYTFGMEFLDQRVYFMTSYAPSLIAELYINFHVLGVFAGFFLFGWSVRLVNETLVGDAPSDFKNVLFAILYGRLVHSMEGPVVSHILFTVFALSPSVLYIAIRVFERALFGRGLAVPEER